MTLSDSHSFGSKTQILFPLSFPQLSLKNRIFKCSFLTLGRARSKAIFMQGTEKLSNIFLLLLPLSPSKYQIGSFEKNSFRNAEESSQNSGRTRTRQGLKISLFSQQMSLQTRLNVMCKVTGLNVTIEPKTVGIHQILNEIQLTVIVVLLGRHVNF